MYNTNEEINETIIPEAYNNVIKLNTRQRVVSARRPLKAQLLKIIRRREKRERLLVIVGATVAGVLFAHISVFMFFFFDLIGVI